MGFWKEFLLLGMVKNWDGIPRAAEIPGTAQAHAGPIQAWHPWWNQMRFGIPSHSDPTQTVPGFCEILGRFLMGFWEG